MISVVTHTRYQRPDLLEKCQVSVKAALFDGAEHHVIACMDNWAQARLDAIKVNEFVAFVDDDDTIDPAALRLCYDALISSGAGLAVTREILVEADGTLLTPLGMPRVKTYGGITIHPRTAHHLCLIRRDAVDFGVMELHHKHGMGIDWFIKASAALVHGAIHVPIDGYFWTQHKESMTGSANHLYPSKLVAMGQDIRTRFPRQDGRLPIYQID